VSFFGLWSLWDMQELKARPFLSAMGALAILEQILEQQDAQHLKVTVVKTAADTIVSTLKEFSAACVALGAEVSKVAADELIASLRDGKHTFAALHDDVRHLQKYFERQLTAAKLLALNPEDARFYDGAVSMFGDDTIRAFPSIASEVDEAGKCLALQRAAAAIFHLMRVVEVALRSMAPMLGITETNPSWNTIIRKIDKEIKLQPRDRTLSAGYAFLEDVSAQMHAVNRAWRTRAMHVDATFSLDNARDIFAAVKSLMQHLATQRAEASASEAPPS
jgi:hypothetical protein